MKCKLFIILFLLALALGVLYYWLLADLPDPRQLQASRPAETTKIYDRAGRLLYEWLDEREGKQTYLTLAEIPERLRQAVIATEDASFYVNPGVDWRGILRSLYLNLRYGRIVGGGSTITQQVARLLLLSPDERFDQTLRRKLREAYLAWRLTRALSKDEILTLYLNHTYYGNLAYGVQAAAEAYFAKSARELDLAECALIAGLPQSPVAYNPLVNPAAARARQADVLGLMVRAGYLDEAEAKLAREEELRYAARPFAIEAPHFVLYVRQLLEEQYGVETVARGGWRVYTTLDLEAQRAAERIVARRLAALNDPSRDGFSHNVHNAALVALDPASGEILAMVGSPDYFDAEIDGAVNGALAPRQPGSAIKPITYAAALAAGYTPATVILDVRQSFLTAEDDSYVPMNYDSAFYGPISLRRALATSSNVAAVSVLHDIGPEAMLKMAHTLGLNLYGGDPRRFGLSMTLGGIEVRLLDLTAAYACLAAEGRAVQPRAILRIEQPSPKATTSLARSETLPGSFREGSQVLDPRIAFLLSDILSDDQARIPAFGEGSALYLGRPAAAKTGTTTDWHDNWTVGYTPDLVVGVWAGNADNRPMVKVSGISGAAPIWRDLMLEMLKGKPERVFAMPEGLVRVEVCIESGLLPNPSCPHRREEWFICGTEPMETCAQHQLYRLDSATGLLATAQTPISRVVEQVFWLPPPEAREWSREKGLPEPPTTGAPDIATARALLAITYPDPNNIYVLSRELPAAAQAIALSARWNGDAPPQRVTLILGNVTVAEFASPPYRLLWPLQVGAHTLSAQAIDARGQIIVSDPIIFRVESAR